MNVQLDATKTAIIAITNGAVDLSRVSIALSVGERQAYRIHGVVDGIVDEKLRALTRVPVSAFTDGERKEIVVWIETAFNGGLVIPKPRIEELGLV